MLSKRTSEKAISKSVAGQTKESCCAGVRHFPDAGNLYLPICIYGQFEIQRKKRGRRLRENHHEGKVDFFDKHLTLKAVTLFPYLQDFKPDLIVKRFLFSSFLVFGEPDIHV